MSNQTNNTDDVPIIELGMEEMQPADVPVMQFDPLDTPARKITQVIRMSSTVLFIDQVLLTVDDPSARINATELFKSCWSFCDEH